MTDPQTERRRALNRERQRRFRQRRGSGVTPVVVEVDPDTLNKLVEDCLVDRAALSDRNILAAELGCCLDNYAFDVMKRRD